MLLCDDLPQAGLEIGVEASAPGPISEDVPLRCGRLNGRHCFPVAVLIAFPPTMVGCDEHLHAARTSGGEDLAHMLDDVAIANRGADQGETDAVQKALEAVGHQAMVTSDPEEVDGASHKRFSDARSAVGQRPASTPGLPAVSVQVGHRIEANGALGHD